VRAADFAALARALFGVEDDTSTPAALRWGNIEAALTEGVFYSLDNDRALPMVEAVLLSGKANGVAEAEQWLADYQAEHPEQIDALDAETTLIGALLLKPETIAGAFEELVEADFIHAPNRALWGALAQADGDATKVIAALVDPELRAYATRLMVEATILPAEQVRSLARMVAQVAGHERGEESEITYKPEPPKPRRFPIFKFSALQLSTRVRYLVERVLPVHGLAVIWGPPKCGKSYWLFDLLMHVALGWTYRGLPVSQGPVVYLALEGAEGFKDRQIAFRQHFLEGQTAEVPFYTVTTRVNLIAEHKTLIEDLHVQLGSQRPVAVGIDTLNRSLFGRESSDEDMTAYINACAAIGDAFDCVVAVVHHCGVDGVRPRGHTSLTGAADSQIRISRDSSKNVVAEVEFMKDGPSGYQNTSKFERIALGHDERGNELATLALVPVESWGTVSRGFRLNDNEKVFFAALIEALLAHAEPPPGTLELPPSIDKVVQHQHVKAIFRKHVIRVDDDEREHEKAIRSAWQAAAKSLRRYAVIGFSDPYFWWTRRPVAGTAAPLSDGGDAMQTAVNDHNG
jgi:hypothetical protein